MSALGKKYKMKSAKYRIQNTKTKYKLQKKQKYKIQPFVRNEGTRPPCTNFQNAKK